MKRGIQSGTSALDGKFDQRNHLESKLRAWKSRTQSSGRVVVEGFPADETSKGEREGTKIGKYLSIFRGLGKN